MGWFDRRKPSAAPLPDADAAMPRWARITRIGREDGPLATVEMDIHYGNAPPFTYTDLVRVPAGLIWVGQDVAVRRRRPGQHSSAGSGDAYEICFGEPPHYALPSRAWAVPLDGARQLPGTGPSAPRHRRGRTDPTQP